MKDLKGKIAVVTGGGTGMGRELVRQLVAEECHVATCDIIPENLEETVSLCSGEAAPGVRITGHVCDVAMADQVNVFRGEVEAQHGVTHINLLFNNAGIGGGGSFVASTQQEWERTFNICWNGVYLMCRTFLPMLLASKEGHVVNTSSVNGFRASFGGNVPHTAYSAAKFAVRGFTEGLINDFRFNAPHLKASIVMPGGVGSDIAINSLRILGRKLPREWSDAEVDEVRESLKSEGESPASLVAEASMAGMSNDEIRAVMQQRMENFASNALTPSQAAKIIIDGVRADAWRILVGKDAEALDRAVRKWPLRTYDLDFDRYVAEEWQA